MTADFARGWCIAVCADIVGEYICRLGIVDLHHDTCTNGFIRKKEQNKLEDFTIMKLHHLLDTGLENMIELLLCWLLRAGRDGLTNDVQLQIALIARQIVDSEIYRPT